jgi:M6 family metalloprotease-like protein
MIIGGVSMEWKKVKYLFLANFLLITVAFTNLEGAPLRNVPVTITQPDGKIVHCFASGDEFYNWLHDKDGYVIIQDKSTGYYTYATKSGEQALISSSHIVGEVDPKIAGLEKQTKPPPSKIIEQLAPFPEGSPANPWGILNTPTTGTINNLIIFIRFSDEAEFTDSVSYYDSLFNASASGDNSVLNYFLEVSYNQLTVSSTYYPTPSEGIVVSYQDSQPRAYYQPYNSVTNPTGYSGDTERTTREHTLLANAVSAISSQVPTSLNIDGDNDGYVDNVIFIVSGSPTGWASLLWPHMWSLYSQTAYINGKRVYTYNFQLQTALSSSGVGVLCHEMFHSLGSPDLYHYSYDGLQPVWKWDIMEYDLNPPQHMGAYMKYRYGTWISSIPRITASGTYTLNPLTSSTNNVYRINSPNSSTQYFLVEYRKKTGTFENSLPGEGLLVYRINSSVDGAGNRNGPPDEVYIYRPGGTTTANGTPINAPYSSNAGRTSINDSTNPSSFLSSGGAGGLNISNVGAIADTISFAVTITTCTYSISPSSQSFTASGGTGSVSVTTQSGCGWTAVSNASWTTITSGSSGTGSGTVNYSVASTTSARTGTMTIAGQTFTVSQEGGETALSNGVPQSGSVTGTSAQSNWVYYYAEFGSGATNLVIDLYNLSADADLYVRRGSKPTTSTYDCRSWNSGTTNEQCSSSTPSSGTWWIGVNNYATGTISYTVKAAWSGGGFIDVPTTHWAYNYIMAIYNNSITVGCSQTPLKYCPDDYVTRGQMAAFIIRAKYGETFSYTTTPYFTDVPSTNTFFKYVQKLRDDGITVVSGTYGVNEYVTRGQMAAFIIRAKFGESFSYTTTPYFSDVPSTHNFFKYVQKLRDEGITAVTGTYYVNNNVTRAEMAAFIARAFLGMQ